MYMPVFGHLDTLPIRIWDEARLAISAYEMLNDGDLIVTHVQGNPDMWSTKPPLLIWVQAAFMKVLGVGELAVRLPSAIAAFLTGIALLVFSLKYLKNFWFGFLAILVLVTCHGYINVHATRTGDYDALLALFTTLSALSFFAFCETEKKQQLYLFFIFTALAVLTKSITGLLFMPAILIYSIHQKQFISLLKNKHFYFGAIGFLVVTLGYYVLREVNNPGFISAVHENELGGRFLTAIEGHQQGFWFYFNNFINFQLSGWHLLVPCGFALGLVSKDPRIKKITLFSALLISTFFLIISTAQTKLEWYDVPLYPFLAILVAVFLHFIFQWLQNLEWAKHTLAVNVLPFLFLFLVGIGPYQKIFAKTYNPQEYDWDKDFYEISYFLKDAVRGNHNLDGQYILYDGYHLHLLFYVNILNDYGVRVSFKRWEELEAGDTVIANQNQVKQYLDDHYVHEIIGFNGTVLTYKILSKKEHEQAEN
jgi:4-amino-4-deoxy-L-arabinose transferase-like glycosyltransferase